ncbi:three-helix bundle dimerization domain-containing protein [Cryobacterium roopkundense]|uniref:three-helix bundle dimerization domain-containing protein n=1 Tax=Cryobacterium roopkundense TaxID=1001240 RepID=UPI003B82D0CD
MTNSARRFPHVSRESIESAVQAEHRIFDGRPVRAYVPNLVERRLRTRLQTISRDVAGPCLSLDSNSQSGLPHTVGDPIQPIE